MEKLISFFSSCFLFLEVLLMKLTQTGPAQYTFPKPMTHPLERVLIYPPKRSSHPLLCDFLHHYITILQFSSPNTLLPAAHYVQHFRSFPTDFSTSWLPSYIKFPCFPLLSVLLSYTNRHLLPLSPFFCFISLLFGELRQCFLQSNSF